MCPTTHTDLKLTIVYYSKQQFTTVNYRYFTSKLWYYGTLIRYGKKYGTIEKYQVL